MRFQSIQRVMLSLGVCCVFCCVGLCVFAAPTSNDRVGKELDEIIKNPKYDWLREGGVEAAPPKRPRQGKMSGKGRALEGGIDPESGDGCSFEPNFKDITTPDEEGGGNNAPGDCACQPDLGNCACDPVVGNCAACAPSSGNIVPLGYGVGIIALVFIVFFVVRALIRKLPQENSALEPEEYDDCDDEEIRVSRIHRLDSASLLDNAHEAARGGDYKKAVGYVYLLAIATLSKAGYVELAQSTTNWHIVQQTRKNGGPVASMNVIVRHFEDLFFGNYTPSQSRFDDCFALLEKDVLPLGQGSVGVGTTGRGETYGH